jgi:hypothetical protein
MRNEYKIVGTKLGGERIFRRFRRRWEDNIKLELK